MKTLKILMLLTSHAQLGASGKPTGFWLEELATPYYVFSDAGADVTLASPRGGAAPADPRSTQDASAEVKRFTSDAAAQKKLANTVALSTVDVAQYDAVFVVGGHGTMWDLSTKDVGAKLSAGWNAGKVLAAVCHGPAALVEVKDEDGKPVVAGRRVAASPTTKRRPAASRRTCRSSSSRSSPRSARSTRRRRCGNPSP